MTWWLIDPEEIAHPKHALIAEKALLAQRERVVRPRPHPVPDDGVRRFDVPSWNAEDTDYLVVLRQRRDPNTGRVIGWEVSCPCLAFKHCWHGYAAAVFHAQRLQVDVPQPPPQPAPRPRGAPRPTRRRGGRGFTVVPGGRPA